MTRVASVYAQALYDLARDEGLSESILRELDVLRHAFIENAAFPQLLSAPSLSKAERCRIIDDSFRGRIQPYVLNFMKLLTEKGYIRHFADCCGAYRDLYNEDNGILPVKAVTALPLTGEQSDRLRAKLTDMTGKTIELSNVIDPDCLGGVRLDYDGLRMDDTIQHRLDSLRKLLRNTTL